MTNVAVQLAGHQQLNQGRFGGQIAPLPSIHRALGHFHLSLTNLIVAIALSLSLSVFWLAILPYVCNFWRWMLAIGLHFVNIDARIELVPWRRGSVMLSIPCLRVTPLIPGFQAWLWNCLITAGLFAATFILRKQLVPIAYLSRGILLVHASACVYFAVLPLQFPHTPDSYLQGLMVSSIALITVVPFLYGLIYYIFDFGAWRKALLTALTMTYLVIFLPFQVLFQALLLQKTILYMPFLYMILSMPADGLIIVAFYSWGMTWKFRESRP